MAASVVSGMGPISTGAAGPAVLFPGRARRDRAEFTDSAEFADFAELEDFLAFTDATWAPLDSELPCPVEPAVDAPPARRSAPRGRRFEHGTRPLSPTPSRPRSSRPANRPVGTLPSAQRARRVGAARVARRGLRLTRRGQIVLFLVAASVMYAVIGFGTAGAGSGASAPRVHQVVVQQGDSLWSIASRVLPNEDPRDAVGEIKSLNHLHSATVQAGQTLRLP